MCGRYVFVPTTGFIDRYDDVVTSKLGLSPNYNVAPTQAMPVETAGGLDVMTWGLVPSWSKEFKPSFTSINARAETIAEKPQGSACYDAVNAIL